MEWNFDGNRIVLDSKPRSTLKITGTRLGTILGLNTWNSPFQAWCEITRLGRVPITDTTYIDAGRAIEPKQIAWTKEKISENIVSPEDYFGSQYPKVKYDFYPEVKRFGGMWDAKLTIGDRTTDVFEYKTTKRTEDWLNGVPLYYLAQVLEYAYLEKARRVHLVVSFVTDKDYAHPDRFVVTDDNTQIFTFDVSSTTVEIDGFLYDINSLMTLANEWWDRHIETGISPEFDEKKDKEILTIIRTSRPDKVSGLDQNVEAYNSKLNEIQAIREEHNLDALEKELEALENAVKLQLIDSMKPTDKKVTYSGFTVSMSMRTAVDTEKLKQDGLYDQYSKQSASYRLTKEKPQ